MEQTELDRMRQFLLAEVNAEGTVNGQDMKQEARELQHKYRIVEEDDQEEWEIAWDDVSGAALDPSAVKKARAEEIDYVRKMGGGVHKGTTLGMLRENLDVPQYR